MTIQPTDWVYLGSICIGLYAASRGSGAALALLGAAWIAGLLIVLDVPFDMATWVLIDVATIIAIEHLTPLAATDWAVIALFAPCWALYHLEPPWMTDAIILIVAAMFLLTVPWDRVRRRWTERPA